MELAPNVNAIMNREGLWPSPGEILLVAVSGGADSLALLHILCELAPRHEVKLHVATFDHGVRGETSAADARYVADLCVAWGVPVTVGKSQIHPEVLKQAQREATLRGVRYRFLAETADLIGARLIATGHHADDQTETILMHLLRGSGGQGIEGMSVRALVPFAPHLSLIRPLLEITRAEIDAYCTAHGLEVRQDETNTDVQYRRNWLRHVLLPLLRENGYSGIDSALRRLGTILQAEGDYFSEQVINLTHEAGEIERERITGAVMRIRLSLAVYRDLPLALQRRWLVWAVQQLPIDQSRNADFEALEAGRLLALTGNHGQTKQLPGGRRLRLGYDQMFIEKVSWLPGQTWELPSTMNLPVGRAGSTVVPTGWRIQLTPGKVENESFALLLPPGELRLRTRQPGDQFAPSKLKGKHRSIARWMVDQKIPEAKRATVPLLTLNEMIIAVGWGSPWVVAYGFDAMFAAETADSQRYSVILAMDETKNP